MLDEKVHALVFISCWIEKCMVKHWNRLNSSFSHAISCRRITPLVAHVLVRKPSIDIGIYKVVYQLRMRILTCTLCCQILQQLSQIGVSGVAVGRALQQLSQRTEVLLHNVIVEDKRVHTHRYVLYKVQFCVLSLAQQQDRYLAKEEIVVNWAIRMEKDYKYLGWYFSGLFYHSE